MRIHNLYEDEDGFWDDKAMKFTNDDAANKLVNPPYRAGWKI